MGFCLFNNVALAARHALTKHKLNRVLIVDWDVHHGNGTQDLFYEAGQVTFFSVHRYPVLSGNGPSRRDRVWKGIGTHLQSARPIRHDAGRSIAASSDRRWKRRPATSKPELVFISDGFDAHHSDPIGDLGLDDEDFRLLLADVQAVADLHCKGRIVSLLEGGYNLDASCHDA